MTIFCVAAHTDAVRSCLKARDIASIAPSFPRDCERWWVDADGNVAIFAADVVAGKYGPLAIALESDLFGREELLRSSLYTNFFTARLPVRTRHSRFQRKGGKSGRPTNFQLASSNSLRGAFVFACWDIRLERLVLARDHFGQHQLYHRHSDDVSLFCSDLAIMLSDRVPYRELDVHATCQYLLSGHPPVGRTLASDIESLPAAHALEWQPSESVMTTARFWTPLVSNSSRLDRDELKSSLREALSTAIATRLAPAGNALLLSGGVDSSYIGALVTRRALGKITAYTIEYDPSYGMNEGNYASFAARLVGANHVSVKLLSGTAYGLLDQILASPVPCSAWATLSHKALLAEAASRGEHCVFFGLGADEIFGGYDKYLDFFFRQRGYAKGDGAGNVDWFDQLLDNKIESAGRLFPGVASFFEPPELITAVLSQSDVIGPLERRVAFYRECRQIKRDAHLFEMMIAHECQHRIPELLLANFETIARTSDVRTVYPYLDPSVVNWATAIRPSDRYWYERNAWWAKRLFRELAAEILPIRIVMRHRACYGAPFAQWLCEPDFGPFVMQRFANSQLWGSGIFRPSLRTKLIKRIQRLPQSTRRTRLAWLEQFWAVLTLCAWYDNFIGG